MRLKTFCLLSPFIVTIVSTLLGVAIAYIVYKQPYGGNQMGVGSGIAFIAFVLFALHNIACGINAYTILLNLVDSVRKNFFLSFLTFFWYPIVSSLCLLTNELGTTIILMGVFPFVVVQILNFIIFHLWFSKGKIKTI